MSVDVEAAVQAVDVASVMGLLRGRPRLLGLGEPTHGDEVLLELRNALFRQLVEREGYRTFALESDCLMGLVVDEYVTTGAGSLDEVMAGGFSHGWGAFAGNRALVRWMRAYNEGRPAGQQVRFVGFDGPLEMTGAASPRQALTGLFAFLAARVDAELLPCSAQALDGLLGADERWTEPAAIMDASRSVGSQPQARQLRLLADDLVALLESQAPHLMAVSSVDEWDRACLFGRTAVGLLRYHRWMADGSPGRMGWLLAVRDSMMAANLLAVAERAALRGPALVSAHNAHLQRHRSGMRLGDVLVSWWSAGAMVGSRLGDGYAFLASAVGTILSQGVQAPPPDTVEGVLYGLPRGSCLVDAGRLAALLGASAPARVSEWYGYAPLDPRHLADADGIVFVKDGAVA